VAYIVDALIITALAIASFVVPVVVNAVGTNIAFIVALVVVALGYFPWFWAHSGATPGMRIFGLRVVRDADGGAVSGGQAVLRLIGFWVSSFVFYLGFIWIFIDKRRRGWHDLIAGTVVVRAR
jgi:uncharacterized RDD family membrane protein YckC